MIFLLAYTDGTWTEREAKKKTIRSAAFQNQNKALYAAARKQGKEIARAGMLFL